MEDILSAVWRTTSYFIGLVSSIMTFKLIFFILLLVVYLIYKFIIGSGRMRKIKQGNS